jgi:hypothetical protein
MSSRIVCCYGKFKIFFKPFVAILDAQSAEAVRVTLEGALMLVA